MAAYSAQSPGLAYTTSRISPLYADFPIWGTDPNDDWWRESTILINRCWHLFRNDPWTQALVQTIVQGILGPSGLTPHSLYQQDPDGDATDADVALRKKINTSLRSAYKDKRFDAVGVLNRRDLSACLLTSKIVAGDGIAIRQWKPSRPGRQYQSTCWRVIDSMRISNPNFTFNNANLFEGFALDDDGVQIGMWIQRRNPYSIVTPDWSWDYIKIFAEDGSRNVIHLKAHGRPDQLRGIGELVPVMAILKHLSGVTEAFVVAKRLQASMGLIVEHPDPATAAANDINGALLAGNTKIMPGKVYYCLPGTKVTPLNFTFQGDDYRMFSDACLEAVCAAFHIPPQVVKCALTEANLAASRAALAQFYRTMHCGQDQVICDAEQPMAESVILEDQARGRLPGLNSGDEEFFHLHYTRPARPFPDPVKEATAAQIWVGLGKSPTTIFNEQGLELQAEIRQTHQDMAFYEDQEVPWPSAPAAGPGQGSPDMAGAPGKTDGVDVPANEPVEATK